MFIGRSEYLLDEKGRVCLPPEFREIIRTRYEDRLVVVPSEIDLEVYPLVEWQRIEEAISQLGLFDPDVRRLSRLYVSRAEDTMLDSAGRILIPFKLRASVGITREVTIIGSGQLCFHIRRRFGAKRSEKDDLSSVLSSLARHAVRAEADAGPSATPLGQRDV